MFHVKHYRLANIFKVIFFLEDDLFLSEIAIMILNER